MKGSIPGPDGNFSLTCYAWPSRVMTGYMEITAHWVDSNWNIHSMVRDFKRIPTPHTSAATAALLFEVVQEQAIGNIIEAITSYNGADAVRRIEDMVHRRNESSYSSY